MPWTQVSYCYDGSFAGFLTCVFESYVHREAPAAFSTPADPRLSLWPERNVETDEAHAKRGDGKREQHGRNLCRQRGGVQRVDVHKEVSKATDQC